MDNPTIFSANTTVASFSLDFFRAGRTGRRAHDDNVSTAHEMKIFKQLTTFVIHERNRVIRPMLWHVHAHVFRQQCRVAAHRQRRLSERAKIDNTAFYVTLSSPSKHSWNRECFPLLVIINTSYWSYKSIVVTARRRARESSVIILT